MKKSDALEHFGNASKLAKALGISPQAVHLWPDEIPTPRDYQIEVLTNGMLKAGKKENEQ